MSLEVADKSEGGDETVGSLLDGRAPMSLGGGGSLVVGRTPVSLDGADESEGADESGGNR